MTDMELTTATALAMGFTILYDRSVGETPYLDCEDRLGKRVYMMWCPLESDEQCMALVRKLGLTIDPQEDKPPFTWRVCAAMDGDWNNQINAEGLDLNRAIVECAAKLHSAE